MRKLFPAAILALFLLGWSSFVSGPVALAQSNIIGSGIYGDVKVSGGGCAASQALDGSNEANTGGATSVGATLTTTGGCGVIVAAVSSNQTITGVSATGLTFTQRATITTGSNITYEFTAPYSSNFSGTITANASSSSFITLIVFGAGGAPSSNYFDPNLASAVTGTGTLSATTTHSNDIIFSMDSNTLNGADSGYILIQSASNFMRVQYRISAAGTYTDSNPGGTGILDAIQ